MIFFILFINFFLSFIKSIHFLLAQMHWSKHHLIHVVIQGFVLNIDVNIHNIFGFCHKVLNADHKINKFNCSYYGGNKSNSHYASKHRLLINAENPLTLKVFINFSLLIKPVLIFNINKLLIGLHH